MTDNCMVGSPLQKGDVVRVTSVRDHSCLVEVPTNNNKRWHVRNDTIETVKALFPKHYKGFKHSY